MRLLNPSPLGESLPRLSGGFRVRYKMERFEIG